MKWYAKLIWGIVFGVLIGCCINLLLAGAAHSTPPHYWP